MKVKNKQDSSPYEVTNLTYNELSYRVRIARDAVSLFYYYGQELQETYPECIDETPEFMTRNIVTQFAFIQISSIFDKTGKYSLRINGRKNNISVSKERLRLLFPIFKDSELEQIRIDLNAFLAKHKKTINTVIDVRNNRIGHIDEPIHKMRESEEYSVFSHQSPIPKSFRYVRITELCTDLRDVLLNEVQFRLEFGESWVPRAEIMKKYGVGGTTSKS